MRKTITPDEMRRVEQQAIQQSGLTGEKLMNRAAAHVARAAANMLREHGGLALCLCGAGNNGGDGLAAMRILAAGDEAFAGECWLLPGALSPDCERELGRLQAEQPQVRVKRLENEAEPITLPKVAVIVDAMFGTGLKRPLEGVAARLCGLVNASEAQVLAVDIPSGLDGATGESLGAAIRADETVVFHRPKLGLYLAQGLDYAGRITVADIGLPVALDDADGLDVLEQSDLPALLPRRKRASHKGSYGRALLFAGSRGMAGAAAVSALAALRAGAGLVTVACPAEIVDIVQTLCPCAMCAPLDMADTDAAWERLSQALERADAVGMGCGLGQTEAARLLADRLRDAAAMRGIPCVIDADALNMMAQEQEKSGVKEAQPPCGAWGGAPSSCTAAQVSRRANRPQGDDARGATPQPQPLYLTPHPAEAARLLDTTTADILRDPVAALQALRERYHANALLKGAATLIATGEGMALNPFGSAAMAKGGSGDALTGVLTALLAGRAAGAYAMSDLRLMQAACALHGLAGEQAGRRYGERGALATDLCEYLGLVGNSGAVSTNTMQASDTTPNDTVSNASSPSAQGAASPLGQTVTVTVDRKLGSAHPKHPELIYQLNYGYVQQVLAADNDWQDAYIYGVDKPVETFDGEVVAVIRRLDDAEDKWVVAKKGARPTPQEIRRATDFQERFFDIAIECL